VVQNGKIWELVFCSNYLAIGYLNLPEKSRKVFLDSFPYSKDRAYRTGDLGRRLESGCIEFVGRCDSQLKIRGYRIELSGIECTVDKIEGVEKSEIIPYLIEDEYIIVAYYTTLEKNLWKPLI